MNLIIFHVYQTNINDHILVKNQKKLNEKISEFNFEIF